MLAPVTPTKICTDCGTPKPATLEFFHPVGGGRYLSGQCRACKSKASAAWNKAHPEAMRRAYLRYCGSAKYKVVVARKNAPEKARPRTLLRRYGITQEDYNRLFAAQKGLCAICERPPHKGKNLSVDHDHKTGRVRGLLCTGCNVFLGRVENGEMLGRALAYLNKER